MRDSETHSAIDVAGLYDVSANGPRNLVYDSVTVCPLLYRYLSPHGAQVGCERRVSTLRAVKFCA